MENYQSIFGLILAILSVISFILILCGGQKNGSAGKNEKKNDAKSKRAPVKSIKSKKEMNNKKAIKNDQSMKQKDETQHTEDPDLKTRDTYDIKTQDEIQEIEKLKAES